MRDYRYDHVHLRRPGPDATGSSRPSAVEELHAKGAEIAIGPLTRNPGLRLAFIRGPEGIVIEFVQR